MPTRVQRTRRRGQPGMPPGAVYVGRPGRWGNPWSATRDGLGTFVFGPDGELWAEVESMAEGRAIAASEYARWIQLPEQESLHTLVRQLLSRRDLACWCPLPADGEPDHCHAAVLLRLAAGEQP
ncbi:DUF4326 domain-containing protein [Streptomyces sp. 184]|uniref:DUF4326 domain-containing protein n=1 Tax=Streptomyces sp. 184 TaxID=1827526 RepID=UPI0038917F77